MTFKDVFQVLGVRNWEDRVKHQIPPNAKCSIPFPGSRQRLHFIVNGNELTVAIPRSPRARSNLALQTVAMRRGTIPPEMRSVTFTPVHDGENVVELYPVHRNVQQNPCKRRRIIRFSS